MIPSNADKLNPARVGDHVETWFDTGALGATLLYGKVIAAGPKTYTVEWESGNRNRLEQGDVRVWRRRNN